MSALYTEETERAATNSCVVYTVLCHSLGRGHRMEPCNQTPHEKIDAPRYVHSALGNQFLPLLSPTGSIYIVTLLILCVYRKVSLSFQEQPGYDVSDTSNIIVLGKG